eukprot:TRINITY_DN50546_c0_g1_i1.p2 TRINITY_DN50546_c0_g1~~TRINITY_DN50546_c0_g1_i1.p2  ORF type:complete len:167 (+),score=51.95 TRINITY_DN50546_c0_g1_i1:150-650(+)
MSAEGSKPEEEVVVPEAGGDEEVAASGVPPPLRPVEEGVDVAAFKYWRWTPEEVVIDTFDATVEACAPFGFYHGQRVEHTKGGYEDAVSTIIGVKDGELYYDPDGQSVGAVCTSNPVMRKAEDFLDHLGWVVVDSTYVAEAHPAGSPKDVPHKQRAASPVSPAAKK